ncbi:MAG: hypothetical protein ACRC6T_09425 [Sarcina sp.]
MKYINSVSGHFIMMIFIICLMFKLARQVKETLYVRRIIKPNDYEKKIIIRSNYIHIVLYTIFIVVYICNILLSLNIINITFITVDIINAVSIIAILAFLIGEFIVIPKINSNIRF